MSQRQWDENKHTDDKKMFLNLQIIKCSKEVYLGDGMKTHEFKATGNDSFTIVDRKGGHPILYDTENDNIFFQYCRRYRKRRDFYNAL